MLDLINNLDTPICEYEKDKEDTRTYRQYFLDGYALWYGNGKNTRYYIARMADLDRTDNLSLNERYVELQNFLSGIEDIEEFQKIIKETNKLH